MSFDRIPAGRELPDDFNVVIEIPMNADPIKYEVDKQSGTLYVDRFMGTAMHYPCNYGYIPNTLSEDGDPVDVLVITPFPLVHGVVVRCRPIGVLNMEDEAGVDAKLLAVPIDKILPWYRHWKEPADMQPERLEQIRHFFEHYKDLERGKWVKVSGWGGSAAARREILQGVENFARIKRKNSAKTKPTPAALPPLPGAAELNSTERDALAIESTTQSIKSSKALKVDKAFKVDKALKVEKAGKAAKLPKSSKSDTKANGKAGKAARGLAKVKY